MRRLTLRSPVVTVPPVAVPLAAGAIRTFGPDSPCNELVAVPSFAGASFGQEGWILLRDHTGPSARYGPAWGLVGPLALLSGCEEVVRI